MHAVLRIHVDPDPDADPNPPIFVIDFQEAN
jgi:hypothetical protein